jgi:hypothetical protein
MKEIGYFNEDENDDEDLEMLKITVKSKLPRANTFNLNVNNFSFHLSPSNLKFRIKISNRIKIR